MYKRSELGTAKILITVPLLLDVANMEASELNCRAETDDLCALMAISAFASNASHIKMSDASAPCGNAINDACSIMVRHKLDNVPSSSSSPWSFVFFTILLDIAHSPRGFFAVSSVLSIFMLLMSNKWIYGR